MQTVKEFIGQTRALELLHALINNYIEGHYMLVLDLLWREGPFINEGTLYDTVFGYISSRLNMLGETETVIEEPKMVEGGPGADPLN